MKYPIGIQSFEQIIREGYVYVDKTDLVYRMVTEGKIYFLSRPRRFGKSLLVSTLENYFQGRQELFKGLAMERLETEWKQYPVFHIDFNGGNFEKDGELERRIDGYIADWELRYGSHPNKRTMGERFAYVLQQAHEQTGQRAVVLIDEYDKPLLDVLDTEAYGLLNGERTRLEDIHRGILKAFYSVFKLADADLQFVLLTGVTKFSQVSVFSGFNQPKDISLDARYEALCGITEEEVSRYFSEPVRDLAEAEGVTEEEMRELIRHQYDGYHFGPRLTDIYNPFSLLNCFDSQQLDNYWFKTGTPTYLVRLLHRTQEHVNEMVGRYYATGDFVDYKATAERPLPMFYQSGYLTIKAYDRRSRSFLLDFPNNEVKAGFLALVAADYLKPADSQTESWLANVSRSLYAGDVSSFRRQLTALLSSTTYRMRNRQDEVELERYFQYTFFLVMKMIGTCFVEIEKETSQGRIDCVVETPGYVYILEFKRDGSASSALRQIEEKGYALPYAADPRRLFRIGVNFSSKTGTVAEFEVDPPVD